MASISNLPPEILDHIFSFLPTDDRKIAQLVCHSWNQQLSSPRYWKKMTLQLSPRSLKDVDNLLRIARQGRYGRIQIFERIPIGRTAQVVELLEASRFSLQELWLVDCNASTLRTVFGTLGKMCRLRNLIVDSGNRARLPKVPPSVSEAVGLASVTLLEVSLINVSYLKLVRRLARQLTNLTLTVTDKKALLVRCLNEPRFTALRALTVEAYDCLEEIHPEELGDNCWRMMAQLEMLRYTGRKVCIVLTDIIRNCRNLNCLAIDSCSVSIACIEQIGALQGLKHLTLNLYRMFDGLDLAPMFELPNLETLYLSPEIGIRLGKQWPKLTSIAFNTPSAFPSERIKTVLSDITKIEGIRERRLREFLVKAVVLDREAIEWLFTLPIDLLTFEECTMDGPFLDILAALETHKHICSIVVQDCSLHYSNRESYNVRSFEKLREMRPHLRIVDINITTEISHYI